ncbi:MAG: 5-formyltetrahydrofolate cyclo-ligase [Epsilonproteobacteria bacterium]|nr:5-formyltetrahydrofolate cyclo-ligase [Campylobacterota bacterium]
MPLTKAIFRQKCLKNIKNITNYRRYYQNAILNQYLIEELKGLKGKNILFYYPLSFEADIRKSLKELRKNCNIFLPFMQNSSFKIVPFRLPLKKKKFGIYEAGNTIRNIRKIDIAIVPVVGVDGKLQRVGFGKGMYDRFFSKLKKKPYTIFIQPKICFTEKFICDDYDVGCDLLLTPRLKKRPKRFYN